MGSNIMNECDPKNGNAFLSDGLPKLISDGKEGLKALIVAADEQDGLRIMSLIEDMEKHGPMCELSTCIADALSRVVKTEFHIIIISVTSSFGKWFEDALELKKSSRGSIIISVAEPDFYDMGLKGFEKISDFSLVKHELSAETFLSIFEKISKKLNNLRKINHSQIEHIDGSAVIAHEIKGAISSIQGFVQALYPTCSDDIQKKYLDYINLCTRTMDSCADIALKFSSLKTLNYRDGCKRCSLEGLANEICCIESEKASKKGIKLFYEIDEKIDYKVMTDISSLGHVLLNLVGNSVKYTQSGEVKLQFFHEGSYTDQTNGDKLERIMICVSDTGTGIRNEDIDKLFLPYYRCKNSEEFQNEGMGLGLYISNRLVKMMGGTGIAVSSEPGRGSSFWFSLGLKKYNGEYVSYEGDSHCCLMKNYDLLKHEKSLNILYAEDNIYNAEIIKKILLMAGHDVRHVENGISLVREAQTGMYDAVLMDLNMPGMNGIAAAANIRETNPDLPLIALTGSVDSDEKIRCIESGINIVLSKPVNINILRKILVLETSEKVTNDFTACSKEEKNKCRVATEVFDCACLLKNHGGNLSLAGESINNFLKSFAVNFVSFKNAYYCDREDMHYRIHKLKESALNAWALSMVKILRGIEKKYREGILGISIENIDCIQKEFDRYKNEVLKFYDKCFGH